MSSVPRGVGRALRLVLPLSPVGLHRSDLTFFGHQQVKSRKAFSRDVTVAVSLEFFFFKQ